MRTVKIVFACISDLIWQLTISDYANSEVDTFWMAEMCDIESPNHKSMCNLFMRISCSPQNREFARINFADLVATVKKNEYARNIFPGYSIVM